MDLSKKLALKGVTYLHISETCTSRNLGVQENLRRLVKKDIKRHDVKTFFKVFREIKPRDPSFNLTVLFAIGEYVSATAILTIDEDLVDTVVFGRQYISTPDLIRPLRHGYPLTPSDRNTFYTHGARRYTIYQTSDGPISEDGAENLRVLNGHKISANDINFEANYKEKHHQFYRPSITDVSANYFNRNFERKVEIVCNY